MNQFNQVNPLISVDSYKLSHFNQYPDGTEHVYSYGAPRSGGPTIITGIHDFTRRIHRGNTEANVQELFELAKDHGVPWNYEGWGELTEAYSESQAFPLIVRGVPDGTVVTKGTPVVSIVNSDPRFPWLTSFFETLLLRCIWYPSTVATVSRNIKEIIRAGLIESGDESTIGSKLSFSLHDFGARGVSSGESSGIGGAAHLLNFAGTDNIEALKYVKELYGFKGTPGFSISASEHSTMTSWERAGEKAAYENMIRKNGGPGVTFACVSDNWNIWKSLDLWKELEPVLLEVGGTLVVRPDSGDPVSTPINVVGELMKRFGYTMNDKGYRVLPDHIRVIQGDGITQETIQEIISQMLYLGLSIDNIGFGMGGGLLQLPNRDDFGWAVKCSAAMVNGVWRDVYKDPIGGSKTSLKGLVAGTGKIPEIYVLTGYTDEADTGLVTYYAKTATKFGDDSVYVRPVPDWEYLKDFIDYQYREKTWEDV